MEEEILTKGISIANAVGGVCLNNGNDNCVHWNCYEWLCNDN